MKRLWLIFSQTATVCLAFLFVVATLRPEWLPTKNVFQGATGTVTLRAVPDSPSGVVRPNSYSEAVRKATPSVVNIFTSKEVRTPKHPLLNDPLFKRFFGDQFGDQ